MSVKSVTLVLENCEQITFDYPSEIYMLNTGDIKEYFVSYGNSIGKQRYVDGFFIIFDNNSGKLGTFSPDDSKLPIERLNQYKDVTGLRIEYEDGQTEYIGVSWEGVDSEYNHSGQGLVLTEKGNVLYYSETGSYKCGMKQDSDYIDSWSFMVKD